MACSSVKEDSTHSSFSGQIYKAMYANVERRKNIHNLTPSDPYHSAVIAQAESVACMVYNLKENGNGKYVVEGQTLAEKKSSSLGAPFGENESFGDEYSVGTGTAFQVTPKHVLTALHCIKGKTGIILGSAEISTLHIVFGFHRNATSSQVTFSQRDVYKIKRVVKHSDNGADWALLQLDRKVEGRAPLATEFVEKIAVKMGVYMLGHPSGISLKFADSAEVKAESPQDFDADLAAFGGNSGSPVFDAVSKKVIGILYRGNPDYRVVNNYYNTGNRRVAAHQVTSKQIAEDGYEKVQKLHTMTFVQMFVDAYQNKADAQYQLGLAYSSEKSSNDKARGLKWLNRAANNGHIEAAQIINTQQASVNTVPLQNSALSQETDAKLEEMAKKALTLGSKGRALKRKSKAICITAGVIGAIITAPILGLPGFQLMKDGLKGTKTRRFNFLAADDSRFNIFIHLQKNNTTEADKEMALNKLFFTQLFKTQTFLKKFNKMLSHSEENANYLIYFKAQKLIDENYYVARSSSFIDCILPTTGDNDYDDYNFTYTEYGT